MNPTDSIETTISAGTRGLARCAMNTAAMLLAVATAAAVLPAPAEAARGIVPVLLQITYNTTGTIERPRIRQRNGTKITFVSNGDVFGAGTEPGHREVFLYDVLAGTTIRVTNTIGGESFSASRVTDDVFARGPDYLTFSSTGTHGVGTSNPEGNPELFLYDVFNDEFHQLTSTPDGTETLQSYPGDSGQCVVFQSTADLHNHPGEEDHPANEEYIDDTKFSNTDASHEVFLYKLPRIDDFLTPGYFTQLSNGPEGSVSSDPVTGGYIFARQCQTTAYLSNHDQLAQDVTGTHLYMFKKQDGASQRMLNKARGLALGDGIAPSGDYRQLHISSASQFARGPNIVFTSNANIWNNESTGYDLYKHRVFHPRMTQMSYVQGAEIFWPTVSDGGGWLGLGANGDLIRPGRKTSTGETGPFNDDGNVEIFQLRNRRLATQITRTVGCTNKEPMQMGSGEMITWVSDCSLIGDENPGGVEQVFLWMKVSRTDPLVTAEACKIVDGCCNEANGCLTYLYGRMTRSPNRHCGLKRRGCVPK